MSEILCRAPAVKAGRITEGGSRLRFVQLARKWTFRLFVAQESWVVGGGLQRHRRTAPLEKMFHPFPM